MASKIVVIGDVDGQFPVMFEKLAGQHAKHNFAFALVVGNLFTNPEAATDEDQENITSLISGKINVPLTTYFALGSHPFPAPIVEKLESSDDGEVCENLYFLGKRTTMKTSEGIRIVALGGRLDPNIIVGESKDKYPPWYNETDARILRGATTADILVTTEWPEGIRNRSKKEFNPDEQPPTQQCIADLATVLKPKYHFSTSGSTFYEREPFFHPQNEDGQYPITKFISLASWGNTKAQKYMYAFGLNPKSDNPTTVPDWYTASPLTLSDNKRPVQQKREASLVYEDHHRGGGGGRGGGGRRPHKRRKYEATGPLDASQCFFCLSNSNVQTHLLTSIGENSYMTTAKGPLPTHETFPELGFPGHMLIIPLPHQSTLAGIEESDRHATYAEMQKYRGALNSMLKSVSGEKYGSVTWELSKASIPHTHWQYLPVPADNIQRGLVEGAFKVMAENLQWPSFTNQDVGDGFEEHGDFFRVMIWDPRDEEGKQTSIVMRFDERIRFQNQFGREVLAKLMGLEKRIDWRDCGQRVADEEEDVEKFKKAFKEFDFAD